MSTSSRDETAEPGPSDRDLTEDGTGRLGLAFNNFYLQRVYVDAHGSTSTWHMDYASTAVQLHAAIKRT